jgi:hypothetical protein
MLLALPVCDKEKELYIPYQHIQKIINYRKKHNEKTNTNSNFCLNDPDACRLRR